MTATRAKGTTVALDITPGALASLRAVAALCRRLGGEYRLAGDPCRRPREVA